MATERQKRERAARELTQLSQDMGLYDSDECRRAAIFLGAERMPDGRYAVSQRGLEALGKHLKCVGGRVVLR